jgi:putative endonuclease
MAGMPHYVYMLECADGTLYTGSTGDLQRRMREHQQGKHHRAYTYSRRPVRLVWFEEVIDKKEAEAREKQVKRLGRKKREQLKNATIPPLGEYDDYQAGLH